MGEGAKSDYEKPAHQVCVESFKLSKYEVTQAQWQAVMGSNPSNFSGCATCPVEKVSWDDIQTFLQKLNGLTSKRYRLPSEAQWEYACRGGKSGQTYCGGNSENSVAWYDGNSNDKTHPVGGAVTTHKIKGHYSRNDPL
ncbi:formylglycine-generating enzyme family protein [Ectothiorhodospiraceae bacterium BW-2]|nr:formylglycine-generating enzyme family protein [Ectothiorhodospiraceae bacterium BW-2]